MGRRRDHPHARRITGSAGLECAWPGWCSVRTKGCTPWSRWACVCLLGGGASGHGRPRAGGALAAEHHQHHRVGARAAAGRCLCQGGCDGDRGQDPSRAGGRVRATGTAPDAICVAAPLAGQTEDFAGPRPVWRARIACAPCTPPSTPGRYVAGRARPEWRVRWLASQAAEHSCSMPPRGGPSIASGESLARALAEAIC